MNTELITNPCIQCGERSKIEVDLTSYLKWKMEGQTIQNAFPDSSTGFRELIQTGIHDACWDEITKEE